jgi:general secretion pathway protein H
VTARTPTSAPGNKPVAAARRRRRGFTLVELLLVLLIIALASGLVSLSLRDADAVALDREAQRLAALLESGRAEARAMGVAARFELVPEGDPAGGSFRFTGLAPAPPGQWLDAGVRAQIGQGAALRLGPEPLIGAQRITLRLKDQTRVLATDGLAPFAVLDTEAAKP